MDLIIIVVLFLALLAGALVAFWKGGLNWVYIYVAGTTGALYVMNFMQVIVFGQLLFIAEVFFAANFLITDIIEEHYGKKKARRVIPIVLGAWVFIWILTFLGTKLNPAEFDPFHGPLTQILSVYTPLAMGLIVVIYSALQYIDTHFYDLIRRKTNGKYLWLRNIGSTFITQSFDVLVSYGILVKVIFPELSWLDIGSAMIAAAAFKYSMVFIDTPFIYLSYKFRPKELLEKEIPT